MAEARTDPEADTSVFDNPGLGRLFELPDSLSFGFGSQFTPSRIPVMPQLAQPTDAQSPLFNANSTTRLTLRSECSFCQ